jgi:hypothetical protein
MKYTDTRSKPDSVRQVTFSEPMTRGAKTSHEKAFTVLTDKLMSKVATTACSFGTMIVRTLLRVNAILTSFVAYLTII